jgi:hypothetical protein
MSSARMLMLTLSSPYSEFMMGIINAGGLVECTKAKLQR